MSYKQAKYYGLLTYLFLSSKTYCDNLIPIKVDSILNTNKRFLETSSQENLSHEERQACSKETLQRIETLKYLYSILNHKSDKYKFLESMNSITCNEDSDQYTKLNSSFLYRKHKIGVILPLTGKLSLYGKQIQIGMESLNKTLGSTFVIRDNKSSKDGSIQALSEFIYLDEVVLVIGGVASTHIDVISRMTNHINIPYLYLHKDSSFMKKKPYVMQFFQNDQILSNTLAKECTKRNYTNISILYPSSNFKEASINSFIKNLLYRNIRVNEIVSYIPENFNSMNRAVSFLTKTLPDIRPEEYQALREQKELEAIQNGLEFNEKEVILKPIMNADAIFIPDNFQNLKFLIKLFKYHGIHKIPLIGTPSWRSIQIIKPWNRFLENAFFVDFIGSYKSLPKSIMQDIDVKNIFLSPKDAGKIDFRVLGRKVAMFSKHLLRLENLTTDTMRKYLQNIKLSTGSFKKRALHRNDLTLLWPTYMFSLRNKKIHLKPDKVISFFNHKSL